MGSHAFPFKSYPVFLFVLLTAFLPGGIALAAGGPGIVFDPYNHVIWIPTRVAGGPVLNFAFDSAANPSAIEWDRAKELNIPFSILGERYAGTGDNPVRLGKSEAIKVAIPGATLSLPMAVVPLGGVSEVYGRRMDGLIGAELLARYVVDLDWESGQMVLHEPASYRYSGTGAQVPLIVAGGMPFLNMTVSVPGAEPVEGLFLVDCPHPGTIIMNTPFVEQNRLLVAARKNLPRLVTQSAEGVGGKSEIFNGRIASIQVGPYTLERPVVGFSQARNGSLSEGQFAGILGAEILRRFRVIFDFSRETMILEPKAALREPFLADASGLRLRSSGPDYREFIVNGIVENSPAEDAKLRQGDRLVEVAGEPAETLSLWKVAEVLKHEGSAVAFKVKRGDQTIEVRLSLRALI